MNTLTRGPVVPTISAGEAWLHGRFTYILYHLALDRCVRARLFCVPPYSYGIAHCATIPFAAETLGTR